MQLYGIEGVNPKTVQAVNIRYYVTTCYTKENNPTTKTIIRTEVTCKNGAIHSMNGNCLDEVFAMLRKNGMEFKGSTEFVKDEIEQWKKEGRA